MDYRREIDGLRALAVVPVILFHAGFDLFSGGFVGVDIFFVLSGYLITALILEDIEQRRFSVLRFYERRARRILPALLLVLGVSIPFAWLWMLPGELRLFAESIFSVSLFLSNFYFMSQVGYFGPSAEIQPLLHTWSLSVEEQFYLFVPPLLLLLSKFRFTQALFAISILLLASLVFSDIASRIAPERNFFFSFSRFWELFAGSIAAYIVNRRGVKNSNLLSMVGLIAILVSIFRYDPTIPFPSTYTLLPVVGVVLIILYAGTETLSSRILSTRVFVSIGLISYSAYLWHQPLFAFARIRLADEPPAELFVALSLASLMLAAISWKYVEQPFRRTNGILLKRSYVFISSALMLTLFGALGVYTYLSDGFRWRLTPVLKGDFGHTAFHRYVDERYVDCQDQLVVENAESWDGFLRCKQSKHGELEWVLLGDSHAEHLFLGLAEANPLVNIGFYTLSEKPYLDESVFQNIFSALQSGKDRKTVFLTMHYASRITSENEFNDGFTKTIEYLLEQGHHVVLVGDVPAFKALPEECVYSKSIEDAARLCMLSTSEYVVQTKSYDNILNTLSAKFSVPYFVIDSLLCNVSGCSMLNGDTLLYRDKHHLNIPGSKLVGRYLSEQYRAQGLVYEDQ